MLSVFSINYSVKSQGTLGDAKEYIYSYKSRAWYITLKFFMKDIFFSWATKFFCC